MGLYWRGLVFPGGNVDEQKEVKYCAVCDCELPTNGSRKLYAYPAEDEVIEVCEACFETRPPDYKEVKEEI